MSKATDRVAAISRKLGSVAHPITGVPTEAKKAAVRAKAATKPHGGKPGSAMASQSVKLSKEDQAQITAQAAAPKPGKPKNTDRIQSRESQRSGPPTLILKAGDRYVTIPQNKLTAELTALTKIGGSLKAVQAYLANPANKPVAKLAAGITGRDAPHASKAVDDARGAKPKAQQAEVKRAVASRGEKTYKSTDKADNSKPDTFRRYMISTIRAHKDSGAAKAAHAKSGKFAKERLNFNWAAANGYIAFA